MAQASAAVVSSRKRHKPEPALLMMIFGGPYLPMMLFIVAAVASLSVRSTALTIAVPPLAWISAATRLSWLARRAIKTTLAPASANCLAASSPMPLEAP